MARERKPKAPKRAAAPKGDFWDAIRVTSDGATMLLTDVIDTPSKDEARHAALIAFLLRGETVRVYIKNRTTGEEIDLTAEVRVLAEVYRGERTAEIEDLIRAALALEEPSPEDEPA